MNVDNGTYLRGKSCNSRFGLLKRMLCHWDRKNTQLHQQMKQNIRQDRECRRRMRWPQLVKNKCRLGT